MHSYSSFRVTSIETIRIVQNVVFGVDRKSTWGKVNLLQWNLNLDLITDHKYFFTGAKVLRVTNSCGVVAILGK